jgi:hypothetical protein
LNINKTQISVFGISFDGFMAHSLMPLDASRHLHYQLPIAPAAGERQARA